MSWASERFAVTEMMRPWALRTAIPAGTRFLVIENADDPSPLTGVIVLAAVLEVVFKAANAEMLPGAMVMMRVFDAPEFVNWQVRALGAAVSDFVVAIGPMYGLMNDTGISAHEVGARAVTARGADVVVDRGSADLGGACEDPHCARSAAHAKENATTAHRRGTPRSNRMEAPL